MGFEVCEGMAQIDIDDNWLVFGKALFGLGVSQWTRINGCKGESRDKSKNSFKFCTFDFE